MTEENNIPVRKAGRPKGSKNKPKQQMEDNVASVERNNKGRKVSSGIKGAKGAQKMFLCPSCDESFTYEFKPDCAHGFYKIPQAERVTVTCTNCKTKNEFRFKTRFILEDV